MPDGKARPFSLGLRPAASATASAGRKARAVPFKQTSLTLCVNARVGIGSLKRSSRCSLAEQLLPLKQAGWISDKISPMLWAAKGLLY